MPDVVKGTLVWDEKKTRRKVVYPTKKGTSPPTFYDAHQLAPALRARTEDEVVVELEVEGGKPVRIRPPGEAWGAAPPPPPPRPRPGAPRPVVAAAPVRADFVNPYNFVPTPPRDTKHAELGDRAPTTHERLQPGTFTGVIRVRLTTETPLLIVDPATAVPGPPGHLTLGVRMVGGKPYLAPTAVKGMLRAAFEAVTNSRFGVFPGHDRRLAYRRHAKVDVEPAVIEEASDSRVVVRVLTRLWQYAPAKLRRYAPVPGRDRGEQQAALRYPDGKLPASGDRVFVRVEPNGRVAAIRRHDGAAGADWLDGWVLVTGANINNKRSERVFVLDPHDQFLPHDGDEAKRLHGLWTDLIADYQVTHERELEQRQKDRVEPWHYLGDVPGKTAWSRHVYTAADRKLQAGMPVYLKRDQATGRIIDLFPVAISRKLFDTSPLAALDEDHRPAREVGELSPADRVFGWVNPAGQGAHRGQLRVGPVACDRADAVRHFPGRGLPLAILGQPKPAQARFYLGGADGTSAGQAGATKEGAGYVKGKRLRGRKVYPHHRHEAGVAGYWDWTTADELAKPGDGRPAREYVSPPPLLRHNQNRSVTGWVEPQTTFTFDLHVTNLTEVELGALAWLLTLGDGEFHRLGLGKPLGFGSVRLTIEIDGNAVHDAVGWKQLYGDFDAVAPAPADLDAARAGFEKVANPVVLGAFRAAAKGFDLPTHYPRLTTSDKAYEWFVENEKAGNHHALPDLTLGSPPGLSSLR